VVLTNKPLKERIQYLNKCVTNLEGRIISIERKEASKAQEVTDSLNEAIIDKRQEGIVVKDPESIYKPDLAVVGLK